MGRGLVIGDVLRNGFAALRKHPTRCLLLLGIIPALWDLPRSQLQQVLFGSDIETSFLFMLASTAWSALLAGGLMLAAIELAAGRKAEFAQLARGVRFAPAVFITDLLIAVPMYLTGEATKEPVGTQVALVLFLYPLLMVIGVRGIVWVPFIVDKRESLATAFWSSWATTRGSSARIVLLCLLWVIPLGAVSFAIFERPLLMRLLSVPMHLVSLLVVAQIYLSLVKQNRPAAPAAIVDTESAQSQPHEDLPVKGTGWARDTNPKDER